MKLFYYLKGECDLDLFDSEFTTGNLESIGFIKDWLGTIAVFVISLVGFGITIFTILKNALFGLYAVSPKLWDKVDDAKRASSFMGAAEGGNKLSKSFGFVTIVMLALLPNVKALTLDKDEQVDPKAYFLRSLPMACVQIFVGVFIFFGYPAQVAEKFSDFGRGLFDVVLFNVDPGYWVKTLPSKFAVLNFSTDGSKDDFDVAINSIARSATTAVIGELGDMEKEKRISLALEVERWVIDTFTPYSEYANTDEYKISVNSRIEISQPNLERVHDKHSNQIHTFAFSTSLDNFNHGSAKDVANSYLRIDIVATDKAQKGDIGSVAVVMEIPSSLNWKESSGTYTLDLGVEYGEGGAMMETNPNASCKIDGEKCDIEAVSGTTIKVKPRVSTQKINMTGVITDISGLKYKKGSYAYPVYSINKTSVNKITFKPKDSASYGDISWVYGESAPTGKDTSGKTSEDTSSKTTSGGTSSNDKNTGFGD